MNGGEGDPRSAGSAAVLGLFRQGYENRKEFIGRFVRAGGRVLAGCDTASFVMPGLCLHRELELLVEAGMTPMPAIQ